MEQFVAKAEAVSLSTGAATGLASTGRDAAASQAFASTSSVSEPEKDGCFLNIYSKFAGFGAIAAVALGVISLIGWVTSNHLFASAHPEWATMKVNTALCLILLGTTSFFVFRRRESGEGKAIRMPAAIVAATGFLTVLEYVLDVDFGIDQMIIPEVGDIPNPGRMALATAVGFTLMGAMLLTRHTRVAAIQSWLAVPVLLLSSLALIGYVLGADELYTFAGQLTGMTIPTAIAFFLLSCAFLLVGAPSPIGALLSSALPGGAMVRWLLPLVVALNIVVVWLWLQAQEFGLFESLEFGAASVAVVNIAVSAVGLLLLGERLNISVAARLDLSAVHARELLEAYMRLEAANKELEAFSYSVSHDLRAPLRAVDGFSQILLEDYAGKLDDEGVRVVNVVRDGAQKMGRLIDDILAFSRVGRLDINLQPVDMEKGAREAIEGLASVTSGRNISFDIQALPAASVDPAMIARVWTNLLDNAVKFTKPKEAAVIEVGAKVQGDETVFYVKDNGVGFDMQYRDKLFGVFQRLHAPDQFPGTGIGLAVVKRIVNRHGGRVWAEGQLDRGATFFFALPAITQPESGVDTSQRARRPAGV